jgi:DNA-binding GntR family transcriptional regulator
MAQGKPRMPKESNSNGLARAVFEGLCHEITTGKLKPGATLPRRQIARRYGSSYTPVIEAMVRLEGAGLVEAGSSRAAARVRRVTPESIRSGYVIREALETQAIRLACVTASAIEIEELQQLAEAIDARLPAQGGDAEGPLLDWEFHRRLAQISGEEALVRELERLELLRRLQANWICAPFTDTPLRFHHQLLVEAVKARDPHAADAAMRTHVRMGLERELIGYRMRLGEQKAPR